MAGSLLMSAGLSELIAKDMLDYEDKAVHLSQHPAEMAELGKRLKTAKDSGQLFNTQRFCQEFEQAIQDLF
jgi:protein O-GlcNAc transferase